jgi:hypothetical protein
MFIFVRFDVTKVFCCEIKSNKKHFLRKHHYIFGDLQLNLTAAKVNVHIKQNICIKWMHKD